MFEYCNPHPEGKSVNDCVKRAITLATDNSYRDVKIALNRYKKVTKSKRFNDRKNVKKYIENVLKGKKLSFPAVKGKARMNGYSFCDMYPKGIYLLNMARHLSVCIDGVIYDTWDCRKKCVYNAWKLK